MHKPFDAAALEQKWQTQWRSDGLYNVGDTDGTKPKEYILVEWPYPSGNLHIGHWYAFAVPDIYVRWRRMHGVQVAYPMGFDAFGLPAENAAIKHSVNPREWTEQNILRMQIQLESMGTAFSWDMTTSSTDPEYYRWTQWMFARFFERDLAYRGTGTVNWCPSCQTVIANEQVENHADGDVCERCGTAIDKREMPQWMLRITDYADRLIDDLDALEWPEHIKEAQRQWIGRSKGAEIDFTLSTNDTVTCFTTRPDTLYGATYLVLAPEHPLVANWQEQVRNWEEVQAYITASQARSEQDRLDATKEKTGVKLEGITATNPASGEEIPVYIADYVLASYGTGAIMAVPAHDERDFVFARKFELPIKSVIAEQPITHAGALLQSKQDPTKYLFQLRDEKAPTFQNQITFFGGGIEGSESIFQTLKRELQEELRLNVTPADVFESFSFVSELPGLQVWVGTISGIDEGVLECHEGEIIKLSLQEAVNHPQIASITKQFILDNILEPKIKSEKHVLIDSAEFDGLDSNTAQEAIVKKVGGRMTSTYRLRDWSIGRQRYWGTPIPIVYDPEGTAHVVPDEHLPWTLPEDVDVTPTGEPPLAKSAELQERTEAAFGKGWRPEVETMDTFVDSSWYYLRYLDPHNAEAIADSETQKTWLPVDIYFGGAEHTTMHLLYSRFWQKVLYDMELTPVSEPYRRRLNRGLILGPDGDKMSKSKGNVIDPDTEVARVGADTVKLYLAFMGPYEGSNYPWDPNGVVGLRRFLERVNGLSEHITSKDIEESTRALHRVIAKVERDIPQYKFNTAISAMMVALTTFEKVGLTQDTYLTLLRVLAPFAPHLTEELWSQANQTGSVHNQIFPEYDAEQLTDTTVTIGVQIDGKVRGSIRIPPNASEAAALEAMRAEPSLAARVDGKDIDRVVYRPGKILNVILIK